MNEDDDEYDLREKLLLTDQMNNRSNKKDNKRFSLCKQDIEMQHVQEFDQNYNSNNKKNNSFSMLLEDNPEKPTHTSNNPQPPVQKDSIHSTEKSKLIKQTSYTINTNLYRNQFILRRLIQDISQGINLACFSYFYCTTVTNSIQKLPFAGLVGYMIASLTNLFFGSSRYVVYAPSFLAISFIRTLSQTYDQGQISMVTALSGVYLLIFSRYLDIQRLIFFVPATVLLGYVYSMVFQFIFNYLDFTLGFRAFNEIGDFFDRIQSIFNHITWYSFVTLSITIFLVVLYLIPQIKYTKYPWLSFLLVVSILFGIFVIDPSQNLNIASLLYKDSEPQWFDFLKYFKRPITSISSFRLFLLVEAFQLAILIYLESLFTLNFAEKECSDKNIQPKREAYVLSIANVISGLFCGIPVSAGIFSTTLNGVLIRRTSKYPRFISLSITVVAEFIVIYFNVSIPYICFAAILIGVPIFTLKMNLYFHENATQKNLEVWTQAVVGFFYNPVISAILGTSYSLLQKELSRYTLRRRSLNQQLTPNTSQLFKSSQKERAQQKPKLQQEIVGTLNVEQNEIQEGLENDFLKKFNFDIQQSKIQRFMQQRQTDQQLSQNATNEIKLITRKKQKTIEKYNLMNDQIVQLHDNTEDHPENLEDSYLKDFLSEEFEDNKFFISRYNENNQLYQEYKQQGIESFICTDSQFIIQEIDGEVTVELVKYVQEQICSKLYLFNTFRGIIIKFKNITFYDMNSLFQIKILLCFLSKKYLPVLVTGMPEQLAEDLYQINPQLFKGDTLVLELKR
ncbi:hypothetical protein ABPG72_011926 [Tetrahymena utriculariae]